MGGRVIRENLFFVGSVHWDRRLFDELIPTPEGTSYNAYLLKDEKATVLIDAVDPSKAGELYENLREAGVERIDYIVCQHVEQDHSGAIAEVAERYPEAVILAHPKAKELIGTHLHIPEERVRTVGDNEVVKVGNFTLTFLHTPWVHWPETVCTFWQEGKVLFTCDFFGSHFSQSGLFADTSDPRLPLGAKRYYGEIMMPFRAQVASNLRKVEGLGAEIIAPSHGPLYDRPSFIFELYRDWSGEGVKNLVLVPYISMHGSTLRMVEHFAQALNAQGVEYRLFNLSVTDLGELAMSLVDAATVVLGTPTVLAGPHPLVQSAAYLASALRPKVKFLSVIGSYGWGGRTLEILQGVLAPLRNAEILPPVIIKGAPRTADFNALDELARNIAQKHREISTVS